MYLRCPECKTRYEIAASSIPEGGARVRCPRCRTVFMVARPAGPPEDGHQDGHAAEEHSAAGTGGASAASTPAGPGAESPARTAPLGADARFGQAVSHPLPAGARPGRDAAVDESTADAVAQAMGMTDDQPAPAPEISTRRERIPGAGGRPIPAAANVVVPGAPVDADLARRIARALVSELLMARRDQRNEALREGRILARLGSAILEANERYRERVGEALADDTRYFQDAVNEIIGDGRPLL